jgi:hypothetical protein
MKKQVYEINEKGMLIKILIAEIDGNGNPLEDLGENIVITDPPNGLYRAKWTGTEWVEDITQEEIEALKNAPKELTQSEMIMLAIADLDVQREIDKTEIQLAVAELAETILGGV